MCHQWSLGLPGLLTKTFCDHWKWEFRNGRTFKHTHIQRDIKVDQIGLGDDSVKKNTNTFKNP